MSLVAPNEGLADQLDYILKSTISGVANWTLVLFKNNLTPNQSTVYADLTLATFGGYSPVTLSRSTWTSAVISADKAVSTYDTTPQIWLVSSGSETIYGYAIVTPSSPVIRYVERFASPIAVSAGGIIGVLPRVTLTTAP